MPMTRKEFLKMLPEFAQAFKNKNLSSVVHWWDKIKEALPTVIYAEGEVDPAVSGLESQLKASKEAEQRLQESLAYAKRTGWHPEVGWLIDGAPEGEIQAYRFGCHECQDWVEGILNGRRGGSHSDPEIQALRERIEKAIDLKDLLPPVLVLALTERKRQLEVLKITPAHDDLHHQGELAAAAACYAISDPYVLGHAQQGRLWPQGWDFNSEGPERNIVKAIALLMAEYERIQRLPRAAAPEGAASD